MSGRSAAPFACPEFPNSFSHIFTMTECRKAVSFFYFRKNFMPPDSLSAAAQKKIQNYILEQKNRFIKQIKTLFILLFARN